jgi:hypothetical protein
MPEGLSVPEVAHQAAHKHKKHGEGGEEGGGKYEQLLEIVEAVLLAVVAVATAWCGYQTGRWDGREAHAYGVADQYRVRSSEAATRSGQGQLYDASVFSFWLEAKGRADPKEMLLFERRFRPEFHTAFTAWLATDPLTNPSAPAGPQLMPQYKPPGQALAHSLGLQAEHEFELGTVARKNGDRYLRDTILLATVLFLTAVASRFRVRNVRVGLLAVSGALLVVAVAMILTYPAA